MPYTHRKIACTRAKSAWEVGGVYSQKVACHILLPHHSFALTRVLSLSFSLSLFFSNSVLSLSLPCRSLLLSNDAHATSSYGIRVRIESMGMRHTHM